MQEQNQSEMELVEGPRQPNNGQPDDGKNNQPIPGGDIKVVMHIEYDGNQIIVNGPQDPILCMMMISDALKAMASGFAEARKKIAESRIIQPGLAPVDKRIIEEAQNLVRG